MTLAYPLTSFPVAYPLYCMFYFDVHIDAGTLANEIIPEEEVKIEVNDAHETDVHINIENDMVSAAMMAAMSNVEPSDISMSMPIIGDMLDNEAEELVTLTEENVKPASVVVREN